MYGDALPPDTDIEFLVPWDPRYRQRRTQPFTVAREIAEGNMPQTFGEAVNEAMTAMPPPAAPPTMAELAQARVSAEREVRRALDPEGRMANPAVAMGLAMIPFVGPIAAGMYLKDRPNMLQVRRLAEQVATEDYKMRVLHLQHQEARIKLDIQRTQQFFEAMANVAKMPEEVQGAYLKSVSKAFGVEIDPAIQKHFLKLATTDP